MKKRVFVWTIILLSLFVLTGCANRDKEKEIIINTKSEVEKIALSTVNNTKYLKDKISQDFFHDSYLVSSCDLVLELEEQNSKGNKVFVTIEDGEYNGKIVGKDNTDTNKYYVYIGSKNFDDLWSYGTIDLTTGNISWVDNY